MVSGLLSEKTDCTQNSSQALAALKVVKTYDSWGSGRKAVKHRRPSRSASGLSRKEVDGKGCGRRRDEGEGEKTDVARGGWAEDARCPPATFFCSGVDPSSARYLGERASIYYEPATLRKSFSAGQCSSGCSWSEEFHLSTLVLVHSIAERVESLRQETPQ